VRQWVRNPWVGQGGLFKAPSPFLPLKSLPGSLLPTASIFILLLEKGKGISENILWKGWGIEGLGEQAKVIKDQGKY
jgi:hypothetical protein